ncbi:MAG: M1 family aminopeptidase [Cyclobacteriaceae bacterium]|uniref:M1 family aminopeptidase n=1 Tax=Fulvivirga sp. TaxID=1931237 RepID=UPI0032EF5703
MKRFIIYFLICISTVGYAQLASQEIDVKHITLDLKFNWSQRQAFGTSSIIITAKNTLNKIALDGRYLSINRITNENGGELNFQYNEAVESLGLIITLDREYKAGEEVTILVDYSTNWVNDTDPSNIWGSFGKGIRFFEPTSTEPNRQKQIWSTGEPESNRYWFPSIDSPNDLRTSTLKATIEKPLKIISNGILKETMDNGNGTQTFIWETTIPYANHLTSFVAGRYLDVTQKYGDVEIHNFCYQHEADATAASVIRLPDMMRFYSEITGVQYPYPSYTQVFVQEFGGWMGNMMTSTITENMVDDYVTHKDFRYLWDITESEALATQWFGSRLSVQDWSHVWLSKSFARHLSGLFNEHKNGRDEFLVYQLQPDQNAYFSDWNSGNRQPIVNPKYGDSNTFVNGNYPYLHGSSVLHMLRKQVGDENWKRILQKYTKENQLKAVSTSDFQQVIEDVSGEKMDWFFNQWVYSIGYPVFKVSKDWNESDKKLTLVVKQVQRLDTLGQELFRGKMLIEIDNKIEEILLEKYEENRFVFKLTSKPKLINFDFESAWVKQVTFEKSPEELLYQYENSKDILARISAMNQLSSIAAEEKTSETTRTKIYETYRETILNHPYWRMRMLTLWQLQGLLVGSNSAPKFDQATTNMLLEVIKKDESWVKSSAVWFLGMTKDPQYADLYINLFEDWSDRVTNAAAISLGKTKSSKAYDALIQLQYKPSWKNQSLISTLNGLQWLNDPRGIELALYSLSNNEAAHWTLSTPIWDHRLAASLTLNALGAESKGFDFIKPQLKKAVEEKNLNDVMYNALQLVNLADPRGKELFGFLKKQYAKEETTLKAIEILENQLYSAIK